MQSHYLNKFLMSLFGCPVSLQHIDFVLLWQLINWYKNSIYISSWVQLQKCITVQSEKITSLKLHREKANANFSSSPLSIFEAGTELRILLIYTFWKSISQREKSCDRCKSKKKQLCGIHLKIRDQPFGTDAFPQAAAKPLTKQCIITYYSVLSIKIYLHARWLDDAVSNQSNARNPLCGNR